VHALISLLALNGLRVSEATGADIEQLGLERGHRTLTITRRAATSSPSRWHRARRGR
jgi:integrase